MVRSRSPALPVLALLAGCGVTSVPIPDEATPGAAPRGPETGEAWGETSREAAPTTPEGAPRLLFPASGARTTSREPRFRWSVPAGAKETRVRICADRACEVVEHELQTRDDAARPPLPLRPGLHFVVLAAVDARGMVAGTSVAPFRVRAGTSSIDSAWGAVPDVDGDGLADLVTTETGPGGAIAIAVRRGDREREVHVLDDTEAAAVATAGDVDGDGFPDVVVTVASTERRARLELWRGSPSGLVRGSASPLPSVGTGETPLVAAGVGDVDGDGRADVTVLAGARLLVYRGSAAGLGTSADVLVSAPEGSSFDAVAPAGDVNGDALADVLVRRRSASGETTVELFLGSSRGLGTSPRITLATPASASAASFATAIAPAGDMDGDGYADVAIAESSAPLLFAPYRVHVYAGSANGPAAVPTWTLVGPTYAGTKSVVLAPAGDVDGDGRDDLLVGSPELLFGAPSVHPLLARAAIFAGAAGGPAAAATRTLHLPAGAMDADGSFGASVAGLGDVDGDGLADVFVGTAQALPGGASRLGFLFRAGESTPSTTLPSAGADPLFGRSLAAAL